MSDAQVNTGNNQGNSGKEIPPCGGTNTQDFQHDQWKSYADLDKICQL